MSKGQKTKQEILLSAIEYIERHGVGSFTVRSFTQSAGINVAALNYYWGSKDNMLEDLRHLTLDNAFSDFKDQVYNKKGKASLELLEEFFLHVYQGTLRWPNIAKMHFSKAFNENDYHDILSKRMKVFLEELLEVTLKLTRQSEKELRLSIILVLSAIYFSGMMGGLYGRFYNVKDEENQKSFIKKLMRLQFHP